VFLELLSHELSGSSNLAFVPFVLTVHMLLLDVNGVSVVDAAGVAIPGSISSIFGIYILTNLAVRLDVEMRGYEVTRIVAVRVLMSPDAPPTIRRIHYQVGL
jgi:presenilin-like A22 family membrane protease